MARIPRGAFGSLLVSPMVLGLTPSAATGQPAIQAVRVAVLPIDNLSGERVMVPRERDGKREAVDKHGEAARAAIQELLVGLPGLDVVERDQVDRMLAELELARSPLAAGDELSPVMGRMLGAQVLVAGCITAADGRCDRMGVGRSQRTSWSQRVGLRVRCTDASSGVLLFARTWQGEASLQTGSARQSSAGDLLGAALNDAVAKARTDQDLGGLRQCLAAPPAANQQRVAVLVFDNPSGVNDSVQKERRDKNGRRQAVRADKYAESCTSQVEQMCLDGGRFAVVDRDRIERLLEEQQFAAGGLVREDQAQQAVAVLGVTLLVTGSILPADRKADASRQGKQRVHSRSIDTGVSIKVIEVETGKVLFQKSFNGNAAYRGDDGHKTAGGDLMLQALDRAFAVARADRELGALLGAAR